MLKCPEAGRRKDLELKVYGCVGDSGNGVFDLVGPVGRRLAVIVSNGGGWEHVSVHVVKQSGKTPTWGEMQFVKDRFWDAEDVVVQFHPRKSEYVNHHTGTLHLWRKVGKDFDTPPSLFVGPKK